MKRLALSRINFDNYPTYLNRQALDAKLPKKFSNRQLSMKEEMVYESLGNQAGPGRLRIF